MPLHRRGKGLSSRVKVPAELRPFLRRAEIHRALGTSRHRDARQRLKLWEAHLGALFERLRREGHSMTAAQIDALVSRYLQARFSEIEEALALDWTSEPDREAHAWSLAERAEVLTERLRTFDYGDSLVQAQQLMQEAEPEAHRRLARRLIEAELGALSAELSCMQGAPLRRPASIPPPSSGVPEDSPRFSEVVAAYTASRIEGGHWGTKTAQAAVLHLRQAGELLGDPRIRDVTKAHMRELQRAVPRLPSNLTKLFGDRDTRDVLAEVEENGVELKLLSPRSVNKFFQTVRSLFNWATAHDYITQNPAVVLQDVDEGRGRDARAPFDDADLEAFFPRLESKASKTELWIARILAYSGMRLGETAQLRKADVHCVDGVWVFDVNADGGKQVKNTSSIRRVPVHPRLKELGLLDLVAKADDGTLWPELWAHSSAERYGPGHNLSKVLMRHLRSSGVADGRKVIHSFRHTVSTRLKALDVPEYHIADILGHENDNITTGRYGKAATPAQLHSVLSKLRLPV